MLLALRRCASQVKVDDSRGFSERYALRKQRRGMQLEVASSAITARHIGRCRNGRRRKKVGGSAQERLDAKYRAYAAAQGEAVPPAPSRDEDIFDQVEADLREALDGGS